MDPGDGPGPGEGPGRGVPPMGGSGVDISQQSREERERKMHCSAQKIVKVHPYRQV